MEFLLKLVGGIEQRSLASCFMTNWRETVVRRQRAMLYPPMSHKGKEVEAALFCWTDIITLFFVGLSVSPVIECWFTVHRWIWSCIFFTCKARSRNTVVGIVTRQWAGQPSNRKLFYHQLDAQNSCLFTYNTFINTLRTGDADLRF